MDPTETEFYQAVLAAGAILTGFSGTFLQFRIQREANYYRQPFLKEVTGENDEPKAIGVDAEINLSHFSAPLLLISLATMTALIFGFLLPMIHLAQMVHLGSPKIVVAGLVAAMVLQIFYFLGELRHYDVFKHNLLNDEKEWRSQRGILATAAAFVLVSVTAIFLI